MSEAGTKAKLVFVGADFRPGGGVADYTRRLAQAFEAGGRGALLIDRRERGLDAFVTEGREAMARGAASDAWVVVQFVGYDWGARGVAGAEAIEALRALCAGRRTAVYLHELWLGENVGAGWRHRLDGWRQRRGVRALLRALAPEKVFTSNAVYRAIAGRRLGLDAVVSPLVGNLLEPTPADVTEADAWLAAQGLRLADGSGLAVVFGAIHPEWRPEAALADWCRRRKRTGAVTAVLAVGRHGPAGADRLAALGRALPELRVVRTGAVRPGLAAALIVRGEVGVATSPWALIRKSGSVASCRELGLPVVATRDDWRWRGGVTPEENGEAGLRLWTAEGFDWAGLLAARGGRPEGVEQIAAGFDEALNAEVLR
jgi:hypothetical protein